MTALGRCECRDCPGQQHARGTAFVGNCTRDAVRYVTVHNPTVKYHQPPDQNIRCDSVFDDVPMCSACATFHESKAGAR